MRQKGRTHAYRYWSRSEKERLMSGLKKYIDEEKKIDWAAVHKKIPHRTMQQCKSLYFNQLKQRFDITYRKNHTWSIDDAMNVYFCGLKFNKDWSLIKSVYFPQFTKVQITMKFLAIDNKHKEMFGQLSKIQEGRGRELNVEVLQKLYNTVTMWLYRHNAAHDGELAPFPLLFRQKEPFPQFYRQFPVDGLEENYLHIMTEKFNLEKIRENILMLVGEPAKQNMSDIEMVNILQNITRYVD